jgi:NAD(P)-dependent dehydrogenase (short-subunit alcohol dehydrogenase family)
MIFIFPAPQNKTGCDALVDAIKKHEPKLHILVNNSGITWGAPFDDVPEVKGWDNILAVNVKSIFYCKRVLSWFHRHCIDFRVPK